VADQETSERRDRLGAPQDRVVWGAHHKRSPWASSRREAGTGVRATWGNQEPPDPERRTQPPTAARVATGLSQDNRLALAAVEARAKHLYDADGKDL
jgi:hypothetical protein